MKNLVVNSCLKYIGKYNNYSSDEIKIIKYGLEGIYLTISKVIIILIIALLLGIFKEVILFLLLFNIIRSTAFGLHASKSYICLISSTLIFIFIPYLCLYININNYIKCLISIMCILYIYRYAPSDTVKRPIVSKKRRDVYKFLSTIISIIYSFTLLLCSNFISNALLFSMVIECFLISPIVYKIFKLPYNNYIKFLEDNPDFNVNGKEV